MPNEVIVDPRYSKYNSKEMEAVFDKVHNADAEPTAESENMISSGAVDAALTDMAKVGEKVGDVPDESPEPEPGE